jgi:hypothetical protein
LDIEAMRKTEEAVTGVFFALSVTPMLMLCSNFPSATSPTDTPGI